MEPFPASLSSSSSSSPAFVQPLILRSCQWAATQRSSVTNDHLSPRRVTACHLRPSFAKHDRDRDRSDNRHAHNHQASSRSLPTIRARSTPPHRDLRPPPAWLPEVPDGDASHQQTRQPQWQLKNIFRPSRLMFATVGAILGTTFGQIPRPSVNMPSGFQAHAQTETWSPLSSSSPRHLRRQPQQQRNAARRVAAVRYNGKQELDPKEKAMSLMLTGGTFAVLGVWAWKQNRRDDELEEIRIKEEVERLEKLRAEFLDVEEDDDSLDDEDLLASLKQRISEEEGTEKGEESDVDDGIDGESDKRKATKTDPITSEQDSTDSNSNNLTNSGEGTDAAPGPDSDSVDMLRRMWEATDDDSKKDKTDSK